MVARRRLVLASFACIFVFVACSDGSPHSGRQAERVPIPQVSLPNGSPLSLEKTAWRRMWRDTPGSPRNRCLDVKDRTDVRSGEFVVGNFASFARYWDGTYEQSKLYYIPLHPDAMAPLEVTATRLVTEPPLTVPLRFDWAPSWTAFGAPFYVSGTVLPERGHWRLEAVAGRNRGCFELQL
jgi:hypothetical protein